MDTTVSGGFDTLSAANALEKVGFSREQAEVLSHTMARAQGDLATKADLAAAQAATKSDLSTLRAETKEDLAAVKSDLAAVKSDVAAVKSDVAAVKSDVAALRREVSFLRNVLLAGFIPLLAVILAILLKPVVFPA